MAAVLNAYEPLVRSEDSAATGNSENGESIGGISSIIDVPGIQPNLPNWTDPARPGTEPDLPRVGPDVPPSFPELPNVDPDLPGKEPKWPRETPSLPGIEPNLPRVGPNLPGVEPNLPPIDPDLPRIDPDLPPAPRPTYPPSKPSPAPAPMPQANARLSDEDRQKVEAWNRSEVATAIRAGKVSNVVKFDRATSGRFAKRNGQLDADKVAAWQAENGLTPNGMADDDTVAIATGAKSPQPRPRKPAPVDVKLRWVKKLVPGDREDHTFRLSPSYENYGSDRCAEGLGQGLLTLTTPTGVDIARELSHPKTRALDPGDTSKTIVAVSLPPIGTYNLTLDLLVNDQIVDKRKGILIVEPNDRHQWNWD
jgi:hypothetical protein